MFDPPIDDYTTCPKCGGKGWILLEEHGIIRTDCPKCRGEGWVVWRFRKNTIRWQPFPHEACSNCGDDVEVFTDCDPGFAWDGDTVRCMSCHYPGTIIVDDDIAHISWHDPEPGCDCKWCKEHPQ